MLIELGFAVNTSVNQCPIINVELDGIQYINNQILNNAGKVTDDNADLQQVTFDADIIDGLHKLKIQSTNITETFKTQGDFGFQLRSIRINKVDLEWFWKPTVSYNPVPNQGYLDHYIMPQNLMHEIEEHNGMPMHVRRDDYANYVNLPGGYIELDFVVPLYKWFLSNNFGNLTTNLLMDFT
jgi:hypothetical protein